MFGKLLANDNAVKLIFDHYKNFAVAAVILAIGLSVFTEQATGQFQKIFQLVTGTCIVLVGLFLIVLNERHGMRKLSEAKLHPFLHLLVIIVYSFSFIAIVLRLTAYNLK